MKKVERLHCWFFVFFLSVLFLSTSPLASIVYGSEYVSDELLVQPVAGVTDEQLEAIFKSHNVTVADTIPQINVKRLKVSPNAIEQVKSALEKTPLFSYIENNFLATGSKIPNDSYYSSQWHLPKISSPGGWDINTGYGGVPIAIIDSGVDPAHQDLSAKLLPGYNYLDNTTNTADVLGHGTSVAGSAAALSNNVTGIAGVAWNNPIMPLVVLDSTNYASYSNIAKAITYAADHGVRVMNISIGGTSSSSTLQNAVNYAWNKGAVIFAAAANNSTNTPYYPAACNNVVAVSATTSSDTLASFSNYGDWIDISAPGASIYTTANGGGYRSASGTSFSSPISAGLAALIISANSSLTNSQVVDIIEKNADDLGNTGFDVYFGYGRINVYKSLMAATGVTPQPDTTAPTVSVNSPINGATVGGTITVSISATDDVGVSKVELLIGGVVCATDTTSPYDFSWNTTTYTDGAYYLEARAYDAAGNIGLSGSVLVYVSNPKDTIPPTVNITSPANGAYVVSLQKISISASDNMGVTKIELCIDGKLATSVTGQTTLSYTWNTRKVANGAHVLTANAYDTAGNMNTYSITVYK